MFQYPYGDTQQLNLDWLMEQWQETKASIDGSLQGEIDRVEAAITDLLTARDQAVAAKTAAETAATSASGYAGTASTAASTATAQATAAAGSAALAGTHASNAQTSETNAGLQATAAGNSAAAAAVSAGNASNSEGAAAASSSAAAGNALYAEGMAKGTQNGTPVASDSPYYENNAAYWAGEAQSHASNAIAASYYSEAMAKGTINGTPVASGDPGYEDNAEYYKDQAAAQAAAAAASAASADGTNAQKMIAAPEEATSTAAAAHAAGTYFRYNSKLYKATQDIPLGGTITPNTNCVEDTVCAELTAQSEQIDDVVTVGKNKLDASTNTENYYVNPSDGQLVSHSTYTASDWIQVEANKKYIISCYINSNQTADDSGSRWCLYDASNNFLAGAVNKPKIDPTQTGVTLATGKTAQNVLDEQAYLRVSYQKTRVNEQVEEGDTVTAYQAFGHIIKENAIVCDTTLTEDGVPADAKATGDLLIPVSNTVRGADVIPTQFGDNLVASYVMSESSTDFETVNAEYTTIESKSGYLLQNEAITGGYDNAEIVFKVPVTVNDWYFICAEVPYVVNQGYGGRYRMNFEIDFGKKSDFAGASAESTADTYKYIMFGNNDGNYSVLFKATYADNDGYAYVRFGAARKIEAVRDASTRKVTGFTWDGTTYDKWDGQIISVDVRKISRFTPAVINKNIAVGTGNGNHITIREMMQNNNLAIGTGQVHLFADNARATESFPQGVKMGVSSAGNNNPSTGNIGIGTRNQDNITTAFYNVSVGYNAQNQLTTGSFNVSLGRAAHEKLTGGMFNVAVGQAAAGEMLNGSWNVSIGNEAHKMLLNGDNNVAIGRRAHNDLENGDMNTVVGSRAGFYPYGSRKAKGQTLIGFEACRPQFANDADKDTLSEYPTAVGAETVTGNHAVSLGAFAAATGENAIAIGGYGEINASDVIVQGVKASGAGSIAIGVDSSGNCAEATAANTCVIGTSNHTIVLGNHKIVFNNDGTVTWTTP